MLNVDAAYDEENGQGSLGCVARDSSGKFIAASCKVISFAADAFMAEAYAMREGLSLAQHLGVNNFIIQSDNLQAIETMIDGGFSSTSSSAIFDDCRVLCLGFRNFTFKHCYREANEVAHELARHSFINFVDCFWDDDPPSFLFPKLINDVTIVDA